MPKRKTWKEDDAVGRVPESWDETSVPVPPQQQPAALQPQPLAENWNLAPLPGGGVLIQIRMLNGVHFSFMPKELALQVAEGLKTLAGQTSILSVPAAALSQLPPLPER